MVINIALNWANKLYSVHYRLTPTVAIWVQHPVPSVIFLHPGTLTLSPERQSARMSKIKNDGLARSGTGCFIAVPIWQ